MPYHSTRYFSELWNISIRKIQQYCKNGQIIGCRKVSGKWEIPDNAIKPIERHKIPFLLMYYNCIQTEFDIRTTTIPYVQRFFDLDYSNEARNFLIQMGYMNDDNGCTQAGRTMMMGELKRQKIYTLGRWFLENAPQYLQFLPYLEKG